MKQQADPGAVRRAQRGDQQARAVIVGDCRELFCRVLGKRGVVGEAQEEVIQEALGVLLRKLPEFRWEAKFETWALAILFRVHQRYIHKETMRRERVVLETEMSADEAHDPWERNPQTATADLAADGRAHQSDPETQAMRSALRQALADCLSRIAIEMREVWVRHRIWGHEHHEIARDLQLKIDTVGTRIHRVDGKMRACLEKKGYTAELLGVGR